MNDRLRRHLRLIAGSLAVLLLAGLGYALRHAGSAHAQPAGAGAQAGVITPTLAPAASRAAGRLSSARAASSRAGGVAARVSTVAAPDGCNKRLKAGRFGYCTGRLLTAGKAVQLCSVSYRFRYQAEPQRGVGGVS